jgi:hypothetical protein
MLPCHCRGARTGAGAGPRTQIAKVAFGQIERTRDLDVTRQRERRVGRVVIRSEELSHLVHAHRRMSSAAPIVHPVVGMIGGNSAALIAIMAMPYGRFS